MLFCNSILDLITIIFIYLIIMCPRQEKKDRRPSLPPPGLVYLANDTLSLAGWLAARLLYDGKIKIAVTNYHIDWSLLRLVFAAAEQNAPGIVYPIPIHIYGREGDSLDVHLNGNLSSPGPNQIVNRSMRWHWSEQIRFLQNNKRTSSSPLIILK